jgi:hypothetical protein
MHAQNLLKLVTRPESPLFPGTPTEWKETEERLGTSLPEDYKWYVRNYGVGLIDDFLHVFNPFSTDKYCRLDLTPESEAGYLLAVLRDHRQNEFADEFPYPAYPEKGGLLPWGNTDQSIILYWLTEGHPDTWRVVVEYPSPWEFTVFEETATSFLEGIITRRITYGRFPDWFPHEIPLIFVP